MSEIPEGLKYTPSHEWIQDDGDGVVTIGVTDHAQQSLGDLVFVELPEVGSEVEAEGACAVVESVKAASDIYAPFSGEIIAINEELEDSPEQINAQPYAEGWIFKMRMDNPQELENLLSASDYADETAE